MEDQGAGGDEDLRICKRFFKRILNLKVSMAIRKWQSEVYSVNMPPEEQTPPAVRGGTSEKGYENQRGFFPRGHQVMAQTAAAFDALSDDKKMLLFLIL